MKPVEKLKIELENLLKHLNQSSDSIYAHDTVDEIKNALNEAISKVDSNERTDKEKINTLIAPTGSLQDISIDNKWGDEFIIIANKIEKILTKL